MNICKSFQVNKPLGFKIQFWTGIYKSGAGEHMLNDCSLHRHTWPSTYGAENQNKDEEDFYFHV